jgi:hypothetical protein
MKAWRKPWLAVGAGLVLVNGVAPWTLQTNLHAGVYRSNADSIAIGLFQIWALSLAGAAGLLLLAGTALAARRLCAWQGSAWLRDLCVVVVGLAYVAALLYFTLWTLAWSTEHHHRIAVCVGLLTLAVAWAGWQDVRALATIPGKRYPAALRTRTSMFG